MKKKVIPFICGAMIIFTGCGSSPKSSKPVSVDENFCKIAEITQDGKEYSAKIKRGGVNIWECTFSAPETIDGMVITCSSDMVNLEFMGLKYSMPREQMPQYSSVALLTSSLEQIIEGKDISCSNSKGKHMETGIVNGQDFTAEFDGENLKSIEISQSFKAEFS